METELERLLVRFVGDASSYMAALQQVQHETQRVSIDVEESKRSIEGFTQGVTDFGRNAVSVLSSLGAMRYLHQAFDVFEGRELTLVKLTSALEANGREVEKTTAEYRRFAAEMSATTSRSGGDVLNMLQQAEAFGVTGAAAERAVKNTIAAQAAGLHASLRMMTGLEEGQTMMLNRVLPALRNIKDPAEKAAKAQELLAHMFGAAKAEAGGVQGQLDSLHKTFKGLLGDMGEFIADALMPVVKWTKEWVVWLKAQSDEAKKAATVVLVFVAAALAVGPALATAGFVWGAFANPVVLAFALAAGAVVLFIHEMGGVNQALEKVGEWLQIAKVYLLDLWKAGLSWATEFLSENRDAVFAAGLTAAAIGLVVATVKILTFSYAALLFVGALLHINQILHTAALVTWAGVMLVAKVVTWLFAAALAATNAALAITLGLLAAAVVVAFAVAVAVAAAAVYAAYQAASSLLSVLMQMPTTYGPLLHIGGLFKEWYGIIGDVVTAAKQDLPLAWELLKAGFRLAVSQVKDMWEPLWTFVKGGFFVLWEVVASAFVRQFDYALAFMNAKLENMSLQAGINLGLRDQEWEDKARATIANNLKNLEDIRKMNAQNTEREIRTAGKQIDELAKQFKVRSSDETDAYRSEVNRIRAEVARLRPPGEKGKEAPAFLPATPPEMPHKEHEAQKMPAAVFGSAEALRRIAEFRDREGTHEKRVEKLLEEVRDAVKGGQVKVQEAGL